MVNTASIQRFVRYLGNPRGAWAWTALGLPGLMFPSVKPLLLGSLGIVSASALAAWKTGQPVWPRTPFTLPCLVIGGMAVIGVVLSPTRDVSLQRFLSLMSGYLLLRAILLACVDRTWYRAALVLYVAAGTGAVLAGLLATTLNNKLMPFWITYYLPRRLTLVSTNAGSVNPNALGAATLFFLPLLIVLLRGLRTGGLPGNGSRGFVPEAVWRRSPRWAGPALFLAFGVQLAALILSQSRGAWMAAAAAAAVIYWPARGHHASRLRQGVLVACVGLACALGMFLVRRELALDLTSGLERTTGGVTMAGRVEIWSRAIYAVRDVPLTGIGLNSFRYVIGTMYPLFRVSPDLDIAHAHNIFLQTALDIGLPGLVGYLALLLVAGTLCWKCQRAGDWTIRELSRGLAGALLAVQVFGLTDAIALGARVGLFFWWNVGLVGALWQLSLAVPAQGHNKEFEDDASRARQAPA